MPRALTPKVTAATLAFLGLLLLVAVVIITSIITVKHATDHVTQNVVEYMNVNAHFGEDMDLIESDTELYVLTRDDEYRDEVEESVGEAREALPLLERFGATDGTTVAYYQAEFARLHERRVSLVPQWEQAAQGVLDAVDGNDAATLDNALARFEQLDEQVELFEEDADALLDRELAMVNSTVTQLTWRVLYSSGGALLITGLAASLMLMYVRRRLVQPIKALSEASIALAVGRLDQTVAITNNDEIGELQRTFNQMAHNLHTQQELLQARNAEAERARAVAEQANQLKSQFLANMSHELRTPLNAIINFTRFLSKERYGPLTERQQDLQARVLTNAEHLLGLINDILDLSKIASGHIELFHEEVELHPILQGVMSTAAGLTKEKGLQLTLDVPGALPKVKIDKTRIRQVLLNLLSNAAKFTEQGSITLRVTRAEDDAVCIAVQDTGIGIAPEHQTLVFEEFRQVEGELTRQYEGTGLGLSISKRLVELHGGRMWLESTLGVGSTFFFTLPALQQVAADEVLAPQPQIDPTRATVVVVDDDANSQRILRDCLESAGYNVRAVLDSRHALAEIRQLQPKLVVLDVLMPHLDGWEVLAQIRSTAETESIPVVICSIVEQQQLGLALGANDYLIKPVREEQLVAVIKNWTSQPARVLVIDDDAEVRQIIHSILSEHGCEVREAGNGVQGLVAVEQSQPDLVVLDLMMPELDGFEVLARLRANPEHAALPVIVVTAKDLSHEERQWLRSNALSCIQKSQLSTEPFLDYILQTVRKEALHVDNA